MSDFLEERPLDIHLPSHAIIDVTLRDGGFATNFSWSLEDVQAIYSAARDAKFDWVELGYVGSLPELHGVNDVGEHADLPLKLIDHIGSILQRQKADPGLCVMIHPSAAGAVVDFRALKETGVDLVRLVYHPSWHQTALRLHANARSEGMKTAINIALVSRYNIKDLDRLASRLDALTPDILYLADTCGALVPDDIQRLYSHIQTQCSLGCHAHDFLSLALANSLAALNSGCTWVDVSWLGLGRGAGNTRAEIWAALLARSKRSKLPYQTISDTIHQLQRSLGVPSISDLPAVLAGASNWTPPQEQAFRESLSSCSKSTNSYD